MAHTLQFQYGSETPVDISTGDYTVVEYTPNPTGKDQAVLRIEASSYANFKSDIEAVNLKYTEARNRRKLGRGPRVYVLWSPDGESDTYRSELHADEEDDRPGALTIPVSFMRGVLWTKQKIKVTITVQRKPYWEDNTETELSLANHLGSGTGGQTVYNPTDATPFVNGVTDISFTASTNRITSSASRFSSLSAGDIFTLYGSTYNDGTYTVDSVTSTTIDVNEGITDEASGDTIYMYDVINYVDITGTDIEGDLPARYRVEVTDSAGSGDPKAVYYAHTMINPQAITPIIEAEGSATGTTATSGGDSSGRYKTLTTSNSTEFTGLILKLTTRQLQNFGSGYYKLLSKRRDGISNVDDMYIRPKFSDASWGVLWVPEQQFYNSGGGYEFIDWGTVKIPPWDSENLSPHEIYIGLYYEKSGGMTITHDYILLLPAENYRYCDFGYGSGTGYTFIDDGIYEQTYQTDTSDNDIGDNYSVGDWPELIPGRDHRVFFALVSDTSGSPQTDAQASVRIYYRARRSLI